jgi:Skp family chaperone for outer membrane proteins
MSFKCSLTLALGVALVLPLNRVRGADAPTTIPSGQPDTMKIGVASVQVIFDNLEETKQIKAKLDDHQQQLKLQAEEMNKNIQNLTTDQNLAKKDSAQYATDSQAIVKAKIELDILVQESNADIEHQNKIQLKHVFDEIQLAVATVAKADGYDLIIDAVTPDLPGDADLDSVHTDQLSLIINQRTILYSDQKNDISREVIAQMNSDFARQH